MVINFLKINHKVKSSNSNTNGKAIDGAFHLLISGWHISTPFWNVSSENVIFENFAIGSHYSTRRRLAFLPFLDFWVASRPLIEYLY